MAPAQGVVVGQSVHQVVQSVQDEWAYIFYRLPVEQQAEKLDALLPRVYALVERNPKKAEPLVIEAFVLCAYAAADPGLGALSKVKLARDLLVKSISLDPTAMEGSAYVTLGNLYDRLPGWPISYGSDDQARQYFEAALKLFPDALDTNYFYGYFLMHQGEFGKALPYLEKAEKAPIRLQSQLADLKLKAELKQELQDARDQNRERGDFYSKLLPTFG